MRMSIFIAGLLIAGAATGHPKDGNHAETSAATEALAPAVRPAAKVVDSFHAALQRGDTTAAQACLADDALIFEAGGVERGKQEYAAHHLGADAAFAKAVPGTVERRAGNATGDIAWIATEGRTVGTYMGKAIDRVTAETIVLKRVGNAWKIAHIHWSSAAGTK